MDTIVRRFPSQKELIAVYAVIVFALYSWMLMVFAYDLSGLLVFLTLEEIVTQVAYGFASVFLESLFVLFFLVFTHFLFPSRFVVLGVVFLLFMFPYAVFAIDLLNGLQNLAWVPWLWGLMIFLLGCVVFVSSLVDRTFAIRKFMENIADRAIIFLYIFLPCSLLSIAFVFIRWFL